MNDPRLEREVVMVAATVLFPEDDARVVLFVAPPRPGDPFVTKGRRWRVDDVAHVERHRGHAALVVTVEPWEDAPF